MEEKKQVGILVLPAGESPDITMTGGTYKGEYWGKLVLYEGGMQYCSHDGVSMTCLANFYSYSDEQKEIKERILQAIADAFENGIDVASRLNPRDEALGDVVDVLERIAASFEKKDDLSAGTGLQAPIVPLQAAPQIGFMHKHPASNDFVQNLLALRQEFGADDVVRMVELIGDRLAGDDDGDGEDVERQT